MLMPGPSRGKAHLRVLVVDDDETVMAVVRAILTRAGHEVETRARAFGTTPYILQAKPDVVLLDIEMPGIDGLELARAIKERAGDTHVVLHSAKPRDVLEALAEDVGAMGAIQKGLPPSEFMRQLTAVLGRHIV
jgi:DNA-binding response OmpR family regulator